MGDTKDIFQVAVIKNEEENTHDVEVDGQIVGRFRSEIEANEYSDLLCYVHEMGYQQKELELTKVTEEDTHAPFEMPDSFTFKNNFAGDSE